MNYFVEVMSLSENKLVSLTVAGTRITQSSLSALEVPFAVRNCVTSIGLNPVGIRRFACLQVDRYATNIIASTR